MYPKCTECGQKHVPLPERGSRDKLTPDQRESLCSGCKEILLARGAEIRVFGHQLSPVPGRTGRRWSFSLFIGQRLYWPETLLARDTLSGLFNIPRTGRGIYSIANFLKSKSYSSFLWNNQSSTDFSKSKFLFNNPESWFLLINNEKFSTPIKPGKLDHL